MPDAEVIVLGAKSAGYSLLAKMPKMWRRSSVADHGSPKSDLY
jgi:hypothetical protein